MNKKPVLKKGGLMQSMTEIRGGLADVPQNPTVTVRLKAQKEELESRLEKVNNALNLLEQNPELQNIFDAISRVGYY